MSESTADQLLDELRGTTRTVCANRERILQRLASGTPETSPIIRSLRAAVARDSRRVNALHRLIAAAFRDEHRLLLWWRTLTPVSGFI
jgi:hypothetical protein